MEDGIVVKLKTNYGHLESNLVEYYAEMDLSKSSSDIFASLIDTDQYWLPLFAEYNRVEACDDESEIIKCKLHDNDQPVYLKR